MSVLNTSAVADLFDPGFLAHPHAALADIQQIQPVAYNPALDMWMVSTHADIRSVLHDPETFLPDNALDAVTPLTFEALRVLARHGFRLPATLANNSRANHPEIRRLVNSYIGPGAIERAMPLIESAAADAVDAAAAELATGECDLVATVAQVVPSIVILGLLGVEHVDAPTFRGWSNASLELFWGRPDARRQLQLAESVGTFHSWLRGQLGISGGILADLRRTDLSVDDQIGACYFTLIAGQETTSQLMSSVLFQLLSERKRWDELLAAPSTAMGWVEETLRRQPPISTWRRITSRAATIGGVDVPAGTRVLLMLTAAGSDPEVFDSPEDMCPHRSNVRQHLAFGSGRHRCPGADLSRVEAAVTVEALASRLPHIELAEPNPPMLPLLSFRSPTRVIARAQVTKLN